MHLTKQVNSFVYQFDQTSLRIPKQKKNAVKNKIKIKKRLQNSSGVSKSIYFWSLNGKIEISGPDE